MPARSRMNELAARKQQLVLAAAAHRESIAVERRRWRERPANFGLFPVNRWWLVGGAALAGWVVVRRLGGIVRWLPAALAVARIAQSLRK